MDSLSFQSQILLEEIPFFHYEDTINEEKRKFLIMLERFSDTNLNLLYCFQENKKFFGNILKEIKCNCIFCETVAFDDIPTILKRMSTEIPILMNT